MANLRVDPADMHTGGQGVREVGQDFNEQLARFQATLAGYDGAWGDDTIGALIGTAYAVVSQWAFDCWQTVADEFVSAGDDLTVMAKGYEDVEQSTTVLFTTLTQNLR